MWGNRRLILLVAWCVAVAIVAVLWYRLRHRVEDLGGIIDGAPVAVATPVAGRVVTIAVSWGDTVQAGQTVAQIDTAAACATRDRLRACLAQERELLVADEAASASAARRQADDLQQAHLTAQAALLDSERELAQQEAIAAECRAELTVLEAEVTRLTQADAVRLGRADGLADRTLARDTQRVRLHATQAALDNAGKRLALARTTAAEAAAAAAQPGERTRQPPSRFRDRIAAIEQQLAEVETTIAGARITAPVAGVVSELAAQPGALLDERATVLRIRPHLAGLQAWLPEASVFEPATGATATITPLSRTCTPTLAQVTFIDTGYESIPNELNPLPGRTAINGRRIHLSLPATHPLLAGEHVRVSFTAAIAQP